MRTQTNPWVTPPLRGLSEEDERAKETEGRTIEVDGNLGRCGALGTKEKEYTTEEVFNCVISCGKTPPQDLAY